MCKMFSGEAPPSMSSAAIRSFNLQVDAQGFGIRSLDNLQAAAADIYVQPPSYNDLVHGQGSSHNQFQDGTLRRELGLVGSPKGPSITDFGHGQGNSFNQDGNFNRGYGYGVQAPSVGAMVHVVVSQPSGGGGLYTDGHPPSLNDVARREASQTGAGNQIVDQQVFPGMSFNAHNFKKFYQAAYYKGKDDN